MFGSATAAEDFGMWWGQDPLWVSWLIEIWTCPVGHAVLCCSQFDVLPNLYPSQFDFCYTAIIAILPEAKQERCCNFRLKWHRVLLDTIQNAMKWQMKNCDMAHRAAMPFNNDYTSDADNPTCRTSWYHAQCVWCKYCWEQLPTARSCWPVKSWFFETAAFRHILCTLAVASENLTIFPILPSNSGIMKSL